MARQRNAFRLGVAALLILALFIAVLVFISGREFGPATQRVAVRFPSTMALPLLKEGSPVFCSGRKVGSVESVGFKEDAAGAPESEAPPLFLHVVANIQRQVGLRRDCKITASGPLLGGTGQLIVRDRGRVAELLGEDEVVEGEPSGSFDAITEALARELDAKSSGSLLAQVKTQLDPGDATSLVSKLHRSMDDINRVSMRLDRELDPTERDVLMAKLHSIVDQVNAATGALSQELEQSNDAALMAKLHESMDTLQLALTIAVAMLEENRAPVSATLAHIQHISEELDRKAVAQIVTELEPGQPANLIAKVHASVDRVIAGLDNVTVITAEGREMVQLNKHNINTALDNFESASGLLKGGLKYVVRHPWVLFNKPSPSEQEQMSIVEAARQFSEAAGRLEDTMASLQALMAVRGETIAPDDEQFAELRAELEGTQAKFNEAEARLWELLSVR